MDRLKEDHARAQYLGNVLNDLNFVDSVLPVETNILIFALTNRFTEKEFIDALRQHDILAMSTGPQTIRFVTHLDFTDGMARKVEEVLRKLN